MLTLLSVVTTIVLVLALRRAYRFVVGLQLLARERDTMLGQREELRRARDEAEGRLMVAELAAARLEERSSRLADDLALEREGRARDEERHGEFCRSYFVALLDEKHRSEALLLETGKSHEAQVDRVLAWVIDWEAERQGRGEAPAKAPVFKAGDPITGPETPAAAAIECPDSPAM